MTPAAVPPLPYKGFATQEDHDKAHQLVRLPRDHPRAPSRKDRAWLKDRLFLCHYSAGYCDYDAYLDTHPWIGPWSPREEHRNG